MSKITRLERSRFSILTNDLSRCYLCGRPKEQLHEIFFGKNRINSMKYGCVVPLCFDCHQGVRGVHHNHNVDLLLKTKGQLAFQQAYPTLDFINIFHKNYI